MSALIRDSLHTRGRERKVGGCVQKLAFVESARFASINYNVVKNFSVHNAIYCFSEAMRGQKVVILSLLHTFIDAFNDKLDRTIKQRI